MSKVTGWIRVSEAAELLGVSPATVRRRVSKGEIEGRKGESGAWELRLGDAGAAEEAVTESAPAAVTGVGADVAGYREELERYQKLAGASVMLAQRRADAAEEAMVRSRAVVHQLRKVAWVTGGTAAAVMVLSCGLLIGLGAWGSSASASAEAAKQALVAAQEDARNSRAAESAATREAARLTGRLEALEQRVAGLGDADRGDRAMASVRSMPGAP
ncbi:MAG: helix-turn-helix domain-containing protein [Planctomycetota bacterium]